jgi:iron complex outermembrane recepter protein
MKHDCIQYCMRGLSLVCLLVLGLPLAGWVADSPASERNTGHGQVVSIEDVVVRGEAVGKDLAATSATVLGNEDIVNRIFITPLDIVSLSPGISIIQYKQGGTASNFIMRGFSGNSHGANTAIFLDGIPLNEGDGYADTNLINPDELQRVELIKGPSSALYGNYASAGALAFYTKKRVDHNHLKLQYGAYNTYEANFVGGLSNDKWDQVYSIQAYHTDGYQDNANWNRQNAAARITRHLSDRMDVRLSLRGFHSDWDAPGYLNQAKYEQDRRQAVSETNGGRKNRLEGRVDLDVQLSTDAKLLFNVWGYNQEFRRYYANDPEGLADDTVVGNLRIFKRDVFGAGASYNYLGAVVNRPLNLIVGADFMVEDDGRERWHLLAGSGREKGPKFWDYDIDMQTVSLYAQSSYQVLQPLRLILGARYDRFNGDLVDHLEGGAKFSMKEQNIFSPKAGILLAFLDERLDLFANYGKGFALLPGFSEQAAFRQDDWAPQERVQYEGGVRVRPMDGLAFGVMAYRLATSKDFIRNPVTDDFDNVGSTTRQGFEVNLDLQAFTYGYLHVDYGYVDATYDNFVSGGVDLSGQTVRSVPQNIVNAEIGFNPLTGFGGRLRYHYEDGYYLDDANLHKSEAWDRFDAQLSYRFGRMANYLLAFDVVNLLNKEYADYTSGTMNRNYSPALPLSVYLTFVVDF